MTNTSGVPGFYLWSSPSGNDAVQTGVLTEMGFSDPRKHRMKAMGLACAGKSAWAPFDFLRLAVFAFASREDLRL